jgi:hypothetical protein
MRQKMISAGFLLLLLAVAVRPIHGQSARKLVINHFVSDPKQNTIVYVTDFDGRSPSVAVNFYDLGGNIIGQKKMTLPENATIPVYPHEVIKRKDVGSVQIESSGGNILAEYWQIIKDEDENFSYSVGVPSHPATGWEKLIVQHFVSDPEVTSVIYVTNPQNSAADVSFAFHDNDGNIVRSVTKTIPSNGSINLKPFDEVKRKMYGNVHISSPGVPVVGEYWQLVDTEVDDKEVKYVVAVPLQSLRSF